MSGSLQTAGAPQSEHIFPVPGVCVPYLNYCFFFIVDDSVVVVFSAGESGLEGSAGFTSVVFVELLDSVLVLGAGAGAGAGVATGTATVCVGGVCWQPVRVRPTAVRASDAKNFQEYGFIMITLFRTPCEESCSSGIHMACWWPLAPDRQNLFTHVSLKLVLLRTSVKRSSGIHSATGSKSLHTRCVLELPRCF
jgi:hypothetical protein